MYDRPVGLGHAQVGADTFLRPQKPGAGLEISRLVVGDTKLREPLPDLSCIENFVGDPVLLRYRDGICKNPSTCVIDDFAALEMISPPQDVRSDAPDSRSSSRHNSCERIASGVYCAPSPIARRVMRVSPWLEPIACGGEKRSIPRTRLPRLAR
jgi:hypothetical protein